MTVTALPLPSPLNNLLLVNWADSVSLSGSYQTDVTPSRVSGAEDRQSLIDKPAREMQLTYTGLDRGRSTQMWMNLARMAEQRTVSPLPQDQTETSAASSNRFDNGLGANVTDLTCDTTLRRFFVGARAVVIQRSAEQIVKLEVAEIATVTDTVLTVYQLGSTFPANSVVMPLIDAEIELKNSGRFKTDSVFNVKVRLKEVPGPSALERTQTSAPTADTHEGLPIWNIPINWGRSVKSGIVRAGKVTKQGRGATVAVRESRPRFEHALDVEDERAEVWSALQWFDWATGRRQAFWLVAPNVIYTPVSVSTTQVAVDPIGLLDDHEDFLENVAVVLNDGTVYIRGIDSITLVSGEWRIVFDAVIPSISLSDIAYVTSAHKVRFQADNYQERWVSPTWGGISMSMVDLLSEEDAAISNLVLPASVINAKLLTDISDLYLWADASGPCWYDSGGGLSPDRRVKPRQQVRWPTIHPWIAAQNSYENDDDCDFVFDVRQAPNDNSLSEPYLQRISSGTGQSFIDSSSANPTLVTFDHETQNNGLPTFYHFGIYSSTIRRTIGFELKNSSSKFWDDTNGMTIFVCVRLGGDMFTSVDDVVLFTWRSGVFEWGNTFVRWYPIADLYDPNYEILWECPNEPINYILALRWIPNSVAALYLNGGAPIGTAAIAPPSLDSIARRAHFLGMRPGPFGSGSGFPQDAESSITRQHFSNAGMIFKQGLSLSEMDVVGDYLARRYDCVWEPATT